MSEIRLGPPPATATIEFREILIDGGNVNNHPFIERMKRENAERAAAAFPPRTPFAPLASPDIRELLREQRFRNKAVIIAQARLMAAEDAEEIAKGDLDAARGLSTKSARVSWPMRLPPRRRRGKRFSKRLWRRTALRTGRSVRVICMRSLWGASRRPTSFAGT
jgi:hypothetical protein